MSSTRTTCCMRTLVALSLLFVSTYAAEAPTPRMPARWQCLTTRGWEDYDGHVSLQMEAAFQEGTLHSHAFDITTDKPRHYIINVRGDDIVQIRILYGKSGPCFGAERPVRRLPEGETRPEAGVAAAGPAAGPADDIERFMLTIVDLGGATVLTTPATSAMTVRELVLQLQRELVAEGARNDIGAMFLGDTEVYMIGDLAYAMPHERAVMADRTLGELGINGRSQIQISWGAEHPMGWEVKIADDSDALDDEDQPLAGRWVGFETNDGTDLSQMLRDPTLRELPFTNRYGRYILRRGSFDPETASDFHQIAYEDDVDWLGMAPEDQYNRGARMMLVRCRPAPAVAGA